MLVLFMLLSTLINQEVRRFYFKLQMMFILSRAMTISYMAYPSLQRKEKILGNSPGKLIFKAVGGRGEKKTNSTEAGVTQSPTGPSRAAGAAAASDQPSRLLLPQRRRISMILRFLGGRNGQETPRRRQTAALGAGSTKQSRIRNFPQKTNSVDDGQCKPTPVSPRAPPEARAGGSPQPCRYPGPEVPHGGAVLSERQMPGGADGPMGRAPAGTLRRAMAPLGTSCALRSASQTPLQANLNSVCPTRDKGRRN